MAIQEMRVPGIEIWRCLDSSARALDGSSSEFR
jgi:hypothetical protein